MRACERLCEPNCAWEFGNDSPTGIYGGPPLKEIVGDVNIVNSNDRQAKGFHVDYFRIWNDSLCQWLSVFSLKHPHQILFQALQNKRTIDPKIFGKHFQRAAIQRVRVERGWFVCDDIDKWDELRRRYRDKRYLSSQSDPWQTERRPMACCGFSFH